MLGIFLLPAILDHLAKEPMIVADAVAAGRDAQCREAIEKAGGEPAKAAIAECRIGFGRMQPIEIDAEIAERHPHQFGQPQVFDDISEQPADQEFERQVIDLLAALRPALTLDREPAVDDAIAQDKRRRHEPVAVGGGRSILAHRQGQLGQHGSAKFADILVARRGVRDRARRSGFGKSRLVAVS